MKVYAVWDDIPAPKYDYKLSWVENDKLTNQYLAAIRAKLFRGGWTGPLSGEIYRSQVADGYAQYMFANRPAGYSGREKCFLFHLEIGDAWFDRDVEFLPKTEIMKRIREIQKMDEYFKKNAKV